jgi:hypothetical protein
VKSGREWTVTKVLYDRYKCLYICMIRREGKGTGHQGLKVQKCATTTQMSSHQIDLHVDVVQRKAVMTSESTIYITSLM